MTVKRKCCCCCRCYGTRICFVPSTVFSSTFMFDVLNTINVNVCNESRETFVNQQMYQCQFVSCNHSHFAIQLSESKQPLLLLLDIKCNNFCSLVTFKRPVENIKYFYLDSVFPRHVMKYIECYYAIHKWFLLTCVQLKYNYLQNLKSNMHFETELAN